METIDTTQLLLVSFIIGITAEAITAALAAGRQRMDLFGVIALAALTALGGGTIRDFILDSYPLTWVEDPYFLIIVVVAALIAVALSYFMHFFRRVFLLADAVGLATFSVIGTQIALELGYGWVIACVAAVVNGVSGGVLRDLMSDRVPLVFQKELYASVSILAAALYMGLLAMGLDEYWVIIITLIFAFGLRVVAMYRGWSLPVFEYRGKDQPLDPHLAAPYKFMRRGLRTARRRATQDFSRYILLKRAEPGEPGEAGNGASQSWESGKKNHTNGDEGEEPVSS